VSYDWVCGDRQFHVHVEPLRGDRGAITGTFGMAWDVTAQYRAETLVRQANQQLEARVAQRTEELAKANLVLMQQIAERKKAEDVRRRVEGELRNVIRNARCMLWHAHIQQVPEAERGSEDRQPFRWITRLYDEAAARQMLQMGDREDVTGQALTEAWRASIPAEDREAMDRTSEAALLAGHEGYTQEYRWVDPAGNVHWLLETVSLQRRPDERWWAVGVVTDITARKLAEAQRDAQRDQVLAERAARAEAEAANRAKDQFLATLSHELRTPLAPVLMTVSHLENDARVPDDVHAAVRMIRRNVELEARLIDDLLDLTRIARGKLDLCPRETDVHSLLCHARDVCRPDADAKRLRVEVHTDAVRCFARGDATRLEQVFWNLLRNAVKFTPEGGSVRVQTRNDDAGRLVIEVTDTGIGIAPEVLPKIFDAFEQGGADVTKQFGGLGLGLAISKALVDLHGGSLTAASKGPGQGATFTVTLETVEAPIFAEKEIAPSLPVAAGTTGVMQGHHQQQQLRILLVEDHADTRKATARLLRLFGHDVSTADCVAAGLRAADAQTEDAAAPPPARPFDLILSDLGLPDGSGLDLVRQLKGRYGPAGLKAIALSGFGMDADLRTSADAGFDAHLVKPVSIEQLESTIRQVVGLPLEAAS
jgi:PAS domain S-box-containing protein